MLRYFYCIYIHIYIYTSRGIKFPTVSALACHANLHGGAARQPGNELAKMQPIRIIQLESPIRICPDNFPILLQTNNAI